MPEAHDPHQRLWFSPHGTDWEAESYEEALEMERDSLVEQLEVVERNAKELLDQNVALQIALEDAEAQLTQGSGSPECHYALGIIRKAIADVSIPAFSPESPCSICGTYGHFTHNHERETSSPASERP